MNRLLKDATVLAPGQKSVTFMTPFNSDWCWSNRTHNIKANEVWAETNVMSELTIPVSLDKMIDCMILEMNEDVMRYNSPSGDHAFEYQKSFFQIKTWCQKSSFCANDVFVKKLRKMVWNQSRF